MWNGDKATVSASIGKVTNTMKQDRWHILRSFKRFQGWWVPGKYTTFIETTQTQTHTKNRAYWARRHHSSCFILIWQVLRSWALYNRMHEIPSLPEASPPHLRWWWWIPCLILTILLPFPQLCTSHLHLLVSSVETHLSQPIRRLHQNSQAYSWLCTFWSLGFLHLSLEACHWKRTSRSQVTLNPPQIVLPKYSIDFTP